MAIRLRELLQIELPIRSLFQARTVELLARAIQELPAGAVAAANAALLVELDAMSEDEAAQRLAARGA